MQCPSCRRIVEHKTVEGIQLDICQGGCGGIWFDQFEIRKFDEQDAPANTLLEIKRDATNLVDPSRRQTCPRCDDVVMLRRFASVQRKVEVDECPGCGGYWLDFGELAQLRSLFPNEQVRREVAAKYFEEVFCEPIAVKKLDDHSKLRMLQAAARWICFPFLPKSSL